MSPFKCFFGLKYPRYLDIVVKSVIKMFNKISKIIIFDNQSPIRIFSLLHKQYVKILVIMVDYKLDLGSIRISCLRGNYIINYKILQNG